MRRHVRAERARANDLEAEQCTVHTKLTANPRALSSRNIAKKTGPAPEVVLVA